MCYDRPDIVETKVLDIIVIDLANQQIKIYNSIALNKREIDISKY